MGRIISPRIISPGRMVDVKQRADALMRESMKMLADSKKREEFFLVEAIREASCAAIEGNYGAGAVVTFSRTGVTERSIGSGRSRLAGPIYPNVFSFHAEMQAMADFQTHYREDPEEDLGEDVQELRTLYTTVEPCSGCTGGIIGEKIRRVIVGALDGRDGHLLSNPQSMSPRMRKRIGDSEIEIRLADVRPRLHEICAEIFALTKLAMNEEAARGVMV